MAKTNGEFGMIGLGRMGGNLARHALEKGFRVVGFTLEGAPRDLVDAGLVEVDTLNGFRSALAPPRPVFVYIPAGPSVDRVLADLGAALEPGDIVVDGGNSYWGDSLRRHAKLAERGVRLVDLGTSGGVEGTRHGACFMASGEEEAIARIEPILRALAVEGATCMRARRVPAISPSSSTTASSSACCRPSAKASTCSSTTTSGSTSRRCCAAGVTVR